jgi:hypothetical protein
MADRRRGGRSASVPVKPSFGTTAHTVKHRLSVPWKHRGTTLKQRESTTTRDVTDMRLAIGPDYPGDLVILIKKVCRGVGGGGWTNGRGGGRWMWQEVGSKDGTWVWD